MTEIENNINSVILTPLLVLGQVNDIIFKPFNSENSENDYVSKDSVANNHQKHLFDLFSRYNIIIFTNKPLFFINTYYRICTRFDNSFQLDISHRLDKSWFDENGPNVYENTYLFNLNRYDEVINIKKALDTLNSDKDEKYIIFTTL